MFIENSADIWSNKTPKNVTFSDYLSTFKSAMEISQLSPFHWLEPALNTSSNKSTAACCQINSSLNPYLGTIGPGPSSSQGSKKIRRNITCSPIEVRKICISMNPVFISVENSRPVFFAMVSFCSGEPIQYKFPWSNSVLLNLHFWNVLNLSLNPTKLTSTHDTPIAAVYYLVRKAILLRS